MSTVNFGRDERDRDPVLKRLGSLPAGVEPPRDLWPGIEAAIASGRQQAAPKRSSLPWQWALAAGVAVAAVSALFTWIAVAPPAPTQVAGVDTGTPAAAQPVSFDRYAQLGPEYVATRAQLLEEFRNRLDTLPPETRDRVKQDLAVIQRAADDIDAALAEDPASRLLNQLLLSTYQQELNFYARVAGAPTGNGERT